MSLAVSDQYTFQIILVWVIERVQKPANITGGRSKRCINILGFSAGRDTSLLYVWQCQ
ncbi:hypothetical protein ANAPC1_00823 [Anaplasma phagocytophilum]|uniref:Uncharacterized protein n=1 Tax=Anaplasma phagocytophilum TaxID=948 RepID=A0AA45UT68_ANAPH|nr:hypothetical protein ANAPC1_00823 [Anaplasma phagocytophilum]